MLKAVRWHSAVDSHVPRAYAFTYDNVNQLDNADWGNVTGTLNGGYGISPSGVQAYKEDIGSYDKNGNIEGLTRKNKAGLNIANYTYNYTTNSNKLEQITGSGNITYEYNLMGQMTKQTESPDTFNIKYNAYGLVSEIRNGTGKRVIIKYRYDDRGNRIVKTLYDRNVASNPEIKSTYYVYDAGGNVLATYEKISGTTQLIEVPVYAAGRVAVYKPLVATTFYEVSDHLGNVRGVIGKPETLIYTATLEDNGQAVYTNPRVQEMAYFKNLSSSSVTDTRFNKSPATTAVPTPANSAYLKWISGMVGQDAAQKSIGPSIGLKVEAGDKIDVEVYVKYKKKTTYSRSGIVGAMASILGGNFAGTAAGIDVLATSTQVFNNGASAAVAISGGAGAENTRPHAYVNALVYDRGFNVNNSLTKVERVPLTAGFDAGNEAFSNHQMLTISTITITEPGYIYIYVSNESENTEVWFDDLKITHQRSNVVAGADYYPFGLAMENREITREDYRYGYQGQFSEEDSVTDYNEFDLRFYDAKIGRWLDVDPEGQFVSPYLAMSNRPNSMIDKDGGMSSVAWFGVGAVVGGITAAYIAKENGASMRTTAGWGLIGGIGGGLIFAGLNNIGDFPKLTAEQLSKVETGVNKSSLIATVLISSGGGKKAGGRLGGHVAVGVGGIAYGFSNRPAPNDDKSILFGLTDKGTWHGEGIFGPSTALGRGDIRYDIPITGAQFMYLFDEVSKLTLNPPDYALLGKRCTAIAARVLRAGKVIGKGSRLHQESPFQFRRYMTRKFKKYKVYGD